jgi:hypothetical protein
MKKKYRSTFWSMETGNEWIQSVIILGETDGIKKEILKYNKAKWKAIAPQVKEWVEEGWTEWEREKPEWFTDNWKARVPADWVPKEGKAEHRNARERNVAERGRKGSVLHESAKKLVNVIAGDEYGPKRKEGGGKEQWSAEAVRGGSRVQPVSR